MAYYKITLDETTEEQRLQLLEVLSRDLNLPIETSYEWRSNRTGPFLQLINEYLYIRHIKHLSGMEQDILIETANDIVNSLYEFQNIVEHITVKNKVGSLTFKFFH
jgi:hypothetical protein